MKDTEHEDETTRSITSPDEASLQSVDHGWSWVVLVAAFATSCLVGALTYAVGIMHAALLELFRESVAVTSWAGALHSALISFACPLVSVVIDRFSCRTAIVLSGLLFMVGYMATAFAPNIGVAIVGTGIISGFGCSLGFTASLVVVGFNFHRRRSIALGISMSGVGVGMFVLAPLMQWARDYYGSRGFFMIVAAMSANLVTLGTLCFPSSLELSTHKKRKLENMRRSGGAHVRCPTLRGYWRVAVNKSVMCISLSLFNYCIGIYVVFIYLPSYIVHNDFTATDAAYFMAISGISQAIGRFLTGAIANFRKLPDIVLYSGSMGIVAISTCLYPLYCQHFAGNVVYSLILGMFYGSCYVVMTNVNVHHVGINYNAAAVGLEFFLGGFGTVIGPVVAGTIVDNGGSYGSAFILAGFCMLLAALLGLASSCFYDDSFHRETDTDKTGEMEICVNK